MVVTTTTTTSIFLRNVIAWCQLAIKALEKIQDLKGLRHNKADLDENLRLDLAAILIICSDPILRFSMTNIESAKEEGDLLSILQKYGDIYFGRRDAGDAVFNSESAFFPVRLPFNKKFESAIDEAILMHSEAVDLMGSSAQRVRERAFCKKKIADYHNELGKYFVKMENYSDALERYLRAAEIFRSEKDSANTSLVYCNVAYLFRAQARSLRGASKGVFTSREEDCYQKALEQYQKALEFVSSGSASVSSSSSSGSDAGASKSSLAAVHEDVSQELAGCLLEFGTRLIDAFPELARAAASSSNPSAGLEEIDKRISDIIFKSLRIFESAKNFREKKCAPAYYHLARLYQQSLKFQNLLSRDKAKSKCRLFERYMTKAIEGFNPKEFPLEHVASQCDLARFFVTNEISPLSAHSFVVSLQKILQCRNVLDGIRPDDSIFNITQNRISEVLQFVLKEFVKFLSAPASASNSGSSSSLNNSRLAEVKTMYKTSLVEKDLSKALTSIEESLEKIFGPQQR